MTMQVTVAFLTFLTSAYCDLQQECAKFYNPANYLAHLPSLRLPYWGDIPVPVNSPSIRPSPVMKTKAISVVTKYVYKNPVCVKYSKGKSVCKLNSNVKNKEGFDKLVTKEYFVKDKDVMVNSKARVYEESDEEEEENDISDTPLMASSEEELLKSSEHPRPFTKKTRKTPELTKNQIQDMLIEDRLDQLETILPHYTRRRVFETSTITVTKVLSNRKTMATLVVKNCIPSGFEICQPKTRRRKSKVAKRIDDESEMRYFG